MEAERSPLPHLIPQGADDDAPLFRLGLGAVEGFLRLFLIVQKRREDQIFLSRLRLHRRNAIEDFGLDFLFLH